VFLYQITNLPSYPQSDRIRYLIRRNGNVFIRVPQERMSQEMRRINLLGGKIVSIKPLNNTNEISNRKDNLEIASVPEIEIDIAAVEPEIEPANSAATNKQLQSPQEDREELTLAWWLEVLTESPHCTYYFGPFQTLESALLSQSRYIKELLDEGAEGITVQIKYCKPQKLTIDRSDTN